LCLPAAQAIAHHCDGLVLLCTLCTGLERADAVCAAAAAAHIVRAALVGICSSVLLFGSCICCVLIAHAPLVAHRLRGQGDAAVGLCITFPGDLQSDLIYGLQHS